MKFIIFIFIFSKILYAQDIFEPSTNWNSLVKDKTIILTEIIGNYLYKYFNNEHEFFSITSSSSNSDQKYFQEDLIQQLIMSSKSGNFTYNFLNELDPAQHENKNTFNLIFVEDRNALM